MKCFDIWHLTFQQNMGLLWFQISSFLFVGLLAGSLHNETDKPYLNPTVYAKAQSRGRVEEKGEREEGSKMSEWTREQMIQWVREREGEREREHELWVLEQRGSEAIITESVTASTGTFTGRRGPPRLPEGSALCGLCWSWVRPRSSAPVGFWAALGMGCWSTVQGWSRSLVLYNLTKPSLDVCKDSINQNWELFGYWQRAEDLCGHSDSHFVGLWTRTQLPVCTLTSFWILYQSCWFCCVEVLGRLWTLCPLCRSVPLSLCPLYWCYTCSVSMTLSLTVSDTNWVL